MCEFDVFFMNTVIIGSYKVKISADVNVFIAEFAELRSLGS